MSLEATEKQFVVRLKWGFADKGTSICIRGLAWSSIALWVGTEMSVKGREVPAT